MEKDNQVVIFEINKQSYALPIYEASEIIRLAPVTKLPNLPSYMEGIMNLRGSIIPVINLNKRLGLPENDRDGSSRIIVVNVNSENKAGLMVEKVHQIGYYSLENFEQPDSIENDENNFLKGIIKKEKELWLLLDLKNLMVC